MAQYRVVDNRVLTEAEYKEEQLALWGVVLFLIGAFIAGYEASQIIPQEWGKAFRFVLVLIAGFTGGLIPALLAGYIRMLFLWLLALGVIGGAGYWVWGAI